VSQPGRIGGAGKTIIRTAHALFRAKEPGTEVGFMNRGRFVKVRQIGHADLERICLDHTRN
jgi:hypothetical protein